MYENEDRERLLKARKITDLLKLFVFRFFVRIHWQMLGPRRFLQFVIAIETDTAQSSRLPLVVRTGAKTERSTIDNDRQDGKCQQENSLADSFSAKQCSLNNLWDTRLGRIYWIALRFPDCAEISQQEPAGKRLT